MLAPTARPARQPGRWHLSATWRRRAAACSGACTHARLPRCSSWVVLHVLPFKPLSLCPLQDVKLFSPDAATFLVVQPDGNTVL